VKRFPLNLSGDGSISFTVVDLPGPADYCTPAVDIFLEGRAVVVRSFQKT
jgi:hypothetical protein